MTASSCAEGNLRIPFRLSPGKRVIAFVSIICYGVPANVYPLKSQVVVLILGFKKHRTKHDDLKSRNCIPLSLIKSLSVFAIRCEPR